MKAKRRCIPNFEARSVLLFAAWSFGMAAGAHAQMAPSPSSPSSSASRSGSQMSRPADAASPSARDIEAIFNRADTNKDGKLSRAEIERLPAMAQRFDQIDTDHDGFVSREEFDKAVKP